MGRSDMSFLLVRIMLTLLCLNTSAVWAFMGAPADTLVLQDDSPAIQISSDVQTWLEPGAQATIAIAAADYGRFASVPALTRYRLSTRDTLWVHLHLLRAPGNTAAWSLNIPMPFLDSVTLYQRNSSGQWTSQNAGDAVAQSDWSKKGLYPEFDLHLPVGVVQDIYLQVRNPQPLSLPIRLSTGSQRDTQRMLELLAAGLMLGALLTLVLLSMVRYLEHRSATDIGSALLGLLIMVTVAQVHGILNVWLWTDVPTWGNYAQSLLPLLTAGCSLLFMRSLFAISSHQTRYDIVVTAAGWSTIASVLLYAVFGRSNADWAGSVMVVFAATVGLLAALLSWRGGSPVGRWLVLAYVPQFAGLMYLVGETYGLLPAFWEARYLTALGVTLSVPLMAYALSRATHDRKELVVRANHLPTQDALTGLLTPEIFQGQLEAAFERAISGREPIALVMVRVLNHEHIRQTYGDTTAEQCLLRAVVKLQRILRDVDPAGRVGTANFALLMEGVITRQALTERMVQLIASGLIPLPGLVPEVTLQFQAACVMLHENPVPPARVLDDLQALLGSMSARTRRPIRFLEPVPTQASELQSQSQTD